MKFSAWLNTASKWEDIVGVAQHVEQAGYDGIWVADHFMPNQDDTSGPTGEAWTILAGLAQATSKARLGTMVTGNTYRHPAVLAKQAAQVDIISGGRLVLGLGAGWQENEHAAYDIPFYTTGERLRRLDEAAQIIRSLFADDQTTFEGRYYTIKDAPLAPKPVQRPGPPLLIGGGGEKVTLRIAAQWADEWNVWGNPEILQHKGEILARHCADVGRDPSEIKHSANAMLTMSDDPERLERARGAPGFPGIVGTVDEVKAIVQQYADAGVDELIIPNFNMGSHARERYDEFIEQVAPEFR